MPRASRWTASDGALLRRLHAENCPLAEIQQALLRTGSACQTRLLVLGLQRRQARVPCERCGRPRFAGNRLPLCRSCMGLSSLRRKHGQPRYVRRPTKSLQRATTCRHCEAEDLRFGYYDRGIREQYPRLRETQVKQEHLEPTVPVLRECPDHAARVRCEHGRWDEECVACERAERCCQQSELLAGRAMRAGQGGLADPQDNVEGQWDEGSEEED